MIKLKFIIRGSGTHVNLFAFYYALVAAISEGQNSGDVQVQGPSASIFASGRDQGEVRNT